MTQDRFRLISAVHLFLVHDGKVLMLRRFNTGFEDGKYSVVAGHIDGGESVTSAMIREAKEEAGIGIQPEHLHLAHIMHRISDKERIDWFFTTSQWRGDVVNCEPTKCDDLSWFSPQSPPENTIPYVKEALQNWQKNIPFSEFGWT